MFLSNFCIVNQQNLVMDYMIARKLHLEKFDDPNSPNLEARIHALETSSTSLRSALEGLVSEQSRKWKEHEELIDHTLDGLRKYTEEADRKVCEMQKELEQERSTRQGMELELHRFQKALERYTTEQRAKEAGESMVQELVDGDQAALQDTTQLVVLGSAAKHPSYIDFARWVILVLVAFCMSFCVCLCMTQSSYVGLQIHTRCIPD